MPALTPEARVSRAANGTIFLGMLSALLALGALVRHYHTVQAWTDGLALGIALGCIGLGYGLRYGHSACLYTAIGLFTILTGYFVSASISGPGFRPVARSVLSGYMLYLLGRAVTPMQHLQAQGAFPLKMSRYGEFFLRRKVLPVAGKAADP